MPQADWTTHADFIIKVLIWVIGLSATALCGTLGWVGRQFTKKFTNMDHKLDAVTHVLMGCDGCAKSLENYGRRKTDLINGSDTVI